MENNPVNEKRPMVQTVAYKCCGVIFAAAVEPYCYEDKDWIKDLKKYSQQGCIIKMTDSFSFGKCECKKTAPKLLQTELFA